jgi:hypothetical protein
VFLIGRDTSQFRTDGLQAAANAEALNQRAVGHSVFAFMPVIDLVSLSQSNEKNYQAAEAIGARLDRIFVPVDNARAFTLTQFETLQV